MATAILHIGTEKTGTSTLQEFLKANREKLNARGFHYARFAGNINHTRLSAYAAEDSVRDDLRIDLGVTDAASLATFRDEMERAAAAEIARQRGRTFLFSNEHCSSRLTSEAEVRRLKAFLDRHFEDVTVTVYLRRQDLVAVSLYSTLLKFGGSRAEILPDPAQRPDYWDYARLLDLWAGVFGRERVVPRIFDRGELAGGSILTDFCTQWGLGSGYEGVADSNESLTPVAQAVLRRMNEAFPGYVDGDLNRMRGELGARFGQLFPGRGARPARAEAEAFYRRFAFRNERVRAEWFPDRATLFPEDFSSYPEDGDPREAGFEEAVGCMIALWRLTQTREIKLRHDLALRDGRIAELEGDLDAAKAAYERAIRIDPTRPRAKKRLKAVEAQRAAPPEPCPETEGIAEAPGEAAPPSRPTVDRAALARRFAAEDRADAFVRTWRKRLSLNGLRRLLGVAPR